MSFRRASEGSRLLVELESRDGSEVWALPFGSKQPAKKDELGIADLLLAAVGIALGAERPV